MMGVGRRPLLRGEAVGGPVGVGGSGGLVRREVAGGRGVLDQAGVAGFEGVYGMAAAVVEGAVQWPNWFEFKS